jgi:four helix bundle protein
VDVKSYRDLLVWQKSMALAEQVYRLTEDFPHSERFGLVQQLRRASVSIASNIAEGHARQTGYYLNHLSMAAGSEAELQTQLELARRLAFVERSRIDPVMDMTAEVGRMLRGLMKVVEGHRVK